MNLRGLGADRLPIFCHVLPENRFFIKPLYGNKNPRLRRGFYRWAKPRITGCTRHAALIRSASREGLLPAARKRAWKFPMVSRSPAWSSSSWCFMYPDIFWAFFPAVST